MRAQRIGDRETDTWQFNNIVGFDLVLFPLLCAVTCYKWHGKKYSKPYQKTTVIGKTNSRKEKLQYSSRATLNVIYLLERLSF